MILHLVMENKNEFKVDYPENLEYLLQELQFSNGDGFLKTTDDTYIRMSKIVQFKLGEEK